MTDNDAANAGKDVPGKPVSGVENCDVAIEPVAAPRSPLAPRETMWRRLVSSALRFMVGLVAAVLLLRALFVEPFGLISGSMAPAFFGVHRRVECPRCRCPVSVGAPVNGAAPHRHYATAICPNCGSDRLGLDRTPDVSGDRLLVDKTAFDWRGPRRWEPVVFRGPGDATRPYVKRAAGLPGEAIQIQGGELYVNSELARKTLAECRAVRVPVFRMAYAPPEGWASRWVAEPPADRSPARGPQILLAAADSGETTHWLTYLHWLLDEQREEPIDDRLAFNGPGPKPEPVQDFSVTCELQLRSGAGSFLVALTDGRDSVQVELPAFPRDEGAVLSSGAGQMAHAPGFALKIGQTYTVELVFCDRRASLIVDGRVLGTFDLSVATGRMPVTRPLKFGARGVEVMIRDVVLYRDIHYRAQGRHGVSQPYQIGPDEYFMLGDNSGNSDDSRSWNAPAVSRKRLLGRPMLLYLPARPRDRDWLGRPGLTQGVDWARVGWVR